MLGSPPRMIAFIDGADSTKPSRTKANWLSGGVAPNRRSLIWPNVRVPSSSNLRLTAHCPFVCCSPNVASVIDEPSSSTGPRMYFTLPSASHVMRGSSWGAFAGSFSGSSQSYARNSASRAG